MQLHLEGKSNSFKFVLGVAGSFKHKAEWLGENAITYLANLKF